MKKQYNQHKRITITIYCKIYTDTFSDDMQNRCATGTEIFNFLMKDSGHSFDKNTGEIIPGDCNLWYLGCNEKFGSIQFDNHLIQWGFGESSFDNVEKFVNFLYEEGMLDDDQFKILSDKITEGRIFDCMYDIPDYLICKKEGRQWTIPEESKKFRTDMKEMMGNINESFEESGYKMF